MSFWWNTVALPILGFMRRAKYPEDAVQLYTLLLRNEVLPLLGPRMTPAYPSWITDDHTPVEFSLILGGGTKSSVRFAFEPSALPLAGDCSITTFRRTLKHLSSSFTMKPEFDLEWFDICAEELLLPENQGSPNHSDNPVSEIFLGFDCAPSSATIKVYFIRTLASRETSVELMERLTFRLGLEKSWAKISDFLSRFLPGDCPKIEIVAIDCVPGSRNRLKIYFRTDILSYAHMEYFLTLGGKVTSVSAGLHQAKTLWNAMVQASKEAHNLPHNQASYFRAGLIYYELKQDSDTPSSKVYLPVQRYFSDDQKVARGVERLLYNFPGCPLPDKYSDFIQSIFPHRELSTRIGIHTYAACTVSPGGGHLSLYYNPETFAPERNAAPYNYPSAQLFPRRFLSLILRLITAAIWLLEDCCLRDLLVFSPTFRMLNGREPILAYLRSQSTRFYGFRMLGAAMFRAVSDSLQLLQGRMHFEDDSATYTAVFTLSSQTHCTWECWALLTVLSGIKHGKKCVVGDESVDVDALIVGGGQAGLATAAQLQQLGIKICVIERGHRVGDAWRDRYEFLQFNTPKDFNHLPYFPFPEDWSMFPPSSSVADHLEKYPKMLGLDVLTSTNAVRSEYDGDKKIWTVWLRHSDGSEFTLRSRHLVVANGVDVLGGLKPRIPELPGLNKFKGIVLHSTSVREVRQWAGKRVVVFGAGCSGHDICMALSRQGAAEVTMIQRSTTAVISREASLSLFPDMYTGDNRPPIDVADQLYLAFPAPASKVLHNGIMKSLALVDKQISENYTSIYKKKGFQLPSGDSDFIERLTVRRGGYYIDQGCSGLIANGTVNVKAYNSIEFLVSDGINLVDGQKLAADIIIFATGYILPRRLNNRK
ncbi:tryptophan dimethylallyltransferase-domain-containing protein [Mycena rebaudengoi]|nr:tryptophan dimethylallyltransferase-domain-containing protein [Mycena rebaudengoi]